MLQKMDHHNNIKKNNPHNTAIIFFKFYYNYNINSSRDGNKTDYLSKKCTILWFLVFDSS